MTSYSDPKQRQHYARVGTRRKGREATRQEEAQPRTLEPNSVGLFFILSQTLAFAVHGYTVRHNLYMREHRILTTFLSEKGTAETAVHRSRMPFYDPLQQIEDDESPYSRLGHAPAPAKNRIQEPFTSL